VCVCVYSVCVCVLKALALRTVVPTELSLPDLTARQVHII